MLERMFCMETLRKSIVFDYAYAGVFWKTEMQETLQLNKYLRLMAYFR